MNDLQPSRGARRPVPGRFRQGHCPTCRSLQMVAIDGRCERCSTLIPRRSWLTVGFSFHNSVLRVASRAIHAFSRVESGLLGGGARLVFLAAAAGLGALALASLWLALRIGWSGLVRAPGPALALAAALEAVAVVAAAAFAARWLVVQALALFRLGTAGPAPDELPPRVAIDLAVVETIRLRGSRGLSIEVTFGTGNLAPGERVEAAARLTRVDGAPIRAALAGYRGPRGEAVARVVSPPIQAGDDLSLTLGLLLPLRALELAPDTPHLRGWVDLELTVAGEVVATHRDELVLALLAEDFAPASRPPPAPLDPAAPGAIAILATRLDAADSTCGVCGDLLAGSPASACRACQAFQHQECWVYLERCSTYGCEGRPEAPV